jgi:acyl carrier protein
MSPAAVTGQGIILACFRRLHVAAVTRAALVLQPKHDPGTLMSLFAVRAVVGRVLQLGPRTTQLESATPLLGAIPELDSMAVVALIGALEEHFEISIADDEIEGATFATLGSLAGFVDRKLGN